MDSQFDCFHDMSKVSKSLNVTLDMSVYVKCRVSLTDIIIIPVPTVIDMLQ